MGRYVDSSGVSRVFALVKQALAGKVDSESASGDATATLANASGALSAESSDSQTGVMCFASLDAAFGASMGVWDPAAGYSGVDVTASGVAVSGPVTFSGSALGVQFATAQLTVTIAANASASGTLQATIPSGYAPVGVMCSALSNAYLMDVRVLSVDSDGLVTYYIRNTSTSSAITGGTATFKVACAKLP